ncbi:MAG: restriction endonuclease subunit S [Candidatus Dechloromonas phosphoritropha]
MSATLRAGYKQTEVGVIPEDWDVSLFSEVFSITAGGDVDPKRSQSFQDDIHCYPIYSNALTNNGHYGYCSYADHPAGSLTITARGMVGSANFRDHAYTAIGRVLVLQPKNDIAGIYFAETVNNRVKFANESTGVPQLTAPQISKYLLPVPPLPEQQAIADALSDADALIESLEQLVAKKRHLKQGTMQELLTGKKRLPGFSGEWAEKRLGELAEMGSGGTPLSSVSEYYDGDIPWVSISDMTKGGKVIESTERNLTALGFANSAAQMFPTDSVLYAMYASLGECSIAGVSLCASQAILGIRVKSNLSSEFLYYYLTSLKPIVKSIGQQGTQSNLNKGMVQDFRISLPPVAEQTAIATILSDMDAEIAELETQLAKTRALKQGMMHKLLTGEIRLP